MVDNAAQSSTPTLPGKRCSRFWPLVALTIAVGLPFSAARAQTYMVIHNFSGQDGENPSAGPTLDKSGNLYGTTYNGGRDNYGVVYKLVHNGPSWLLTTLYSFTGGEDGAHPGLGSLVRGADGTLYGTTVAGGSNGKGTAFSLSAPRTAKACITVLCPWKETVLHPFGGAGDGDFPNGAIIFDSAGNLYGTTTYGGAYGNGTVFELTPAGDSWTETIVYSFAGGDDGGSPTSGIILGSDGNLYGTTSNGGVDDDGTAFELAHSGSGWTKTTLYSFHYESDGGGPTGLTFDSAGNLFGGTIYGGPNGGGVVYELSPVNGTWSYTLLYSFKTGFFGLGGPASALTLDTSGDVYGTTSEDGAYFGGSVFELTPSDDGWTFTDLHNFTGGDDGDDPNGSLTIDAAGNIYGTTTTGGTNDLGVVFELTP